MNRFNRGCFALLAVALSLALCACSACQKTSAGESRKAVTVMFTNDVLGEYAPCG